jgi:dTDP-4-amino-4,6-dideoxy-D-galactose acyltransferase
MIAEPGEGGEMEAYRILEWDSGFFGFAVARIALPGASCKDLERVVSELRRRSVRLAYWSVDSSETRFDPGFPLRLGGRLVDEKTTFLADLEGVARPAKAGGCGAGVVVEAYSPSMPKADVHGLAIQSGQYSRFAVDPHIPRAKFEELYTIWADKALAKEMADEVLVIRNGQERVVGMATLGRKGERGDIGLIAVDVHFRGRKLGETLVRRAQEWFIARGCRYGQVVTQGANTPACRLYAKCGYCVEKVEHYYHFWL